MAAVENALDKASKIVYTNFQHINKVCDLLKPSVAYAMI